MPRERPRKPDPPARKRRDPDEARALILDAAERVFAKHVPDVVGLKDVAREADVSHALVSHYFGSYEALVEKTLERRLDAVRAHVMAEIARPGIPRERLLDVLAEVIRDPLTLRLLAWAMLTGRTRRGDFFGSRNQGLRQIADALAAVRAREELPVLPRGDIEFAILATITLMLGYGLSREALVGSLGHSITPHALAQADADFRARVRDLLQAYLTRPAS
jgi:AcrR family transcriptional regulator